MIRRNSNISDPDSMMFSARSLQEVVKSFEKRADPSENPHLFEGQFIAAPVLLTLAMELALKAWWAREVKDKVVPRTHDLMKLFDGLPEQTRKRLESSYPEPPTSHNPLLLPARKDLRSLLELNRIKFVEWRYLHEHSSNSFPDGQFNVALSSLIDEFFKSTVG